MYIANELKENLRQNVKAIRKYQKKSLEEFSEEIGIARSTLQDVESGHSNPRLDTLEVIAMNLDIPLQQLLAPAAAMKRQRIEYGLLEQLDLFLQFTTEQRKEFAGLFFKMIDMLESLDR